MTSPTTTPIKYRGPAASRIRSTATKAEIADYVARGLIAPTAAEAEAGLVSTRCPASGWKSMNQIEGSTTCPECGNTVQINDCELAWHSETKES